MRRSRRHLGWSTALVIGAAMLAPAPGLGAEFRADLGTDGPPGGCEPGACTLREAILRANSNPGPDVVLLRPRVTYRLQIAGPGEDGGRSGDLDITDQARILAVGRGRATVDAAGLDRAFDLFADTEVEGVRVTGGLAPELGGAEGAAIRARDGRLTLRDTAVRENLGPQSAIALTGERGMTVRGGSIADNSGTGVIDHGGGGFRGARTVIAGNDGAGVQGFGPGSIGLYHAVVRDNLLRGVQELDDGDIALVDTIGSSNGDQAADEHGEGGLFVRRSRLRHNGAEALEESGAGELFVYRSRLANSAQEAAVEHDYGGISLVKSRITASGAAALSEFGEGGIGIEETEVLGSGLEGAVEREKGGIGLTLSTLGSSAAGGLVESGEGGMTLNRARVADNGGAGLALDGSASLIRSRVVANRGGISIAAGELWLNRSSVSDNDGELGGIAATDATLSLRQSTLGGNRTSADGGAIALRGASELEAQNTTLAENTAAGDGGGLFVGAGSDAGLNAVTVASNRAGDGEEDGGGDGGGIIVLAGGAVVLDNSLLAANSGSAVGADCSGSLESGGGNLLTDLGGCEGLDGPDDLLAADARIGRLRANGGPTRTVALRRGSAAVDAAGDDAPERDQRNLPRRDPDAGAFERR